MSLTLTKIRNWLVVFGTTRTPEGPMLYFQRVYFLLGFSTIIKKIHHRHGTNLRHWVERRNDRECVIKNPFGYYAVNAKNDSLTKSLTSFEYTHQPWLAQADHTDTFIDIGANIGFYSLLAVSRYTYQNAYAFEPNPDTFNRMQQNVTLNGHHDTIFTSSLALSDTTGGASLIAEPVHTGGSSLTTPHSGTSASQVSVTLCPFDTWATAEGMNVSTLSFIKIDVEGHELEVLRGMQQTLPQLRTGTCIFIEIQPKTATGAESRGILHDAGFTEIANTRQRNFLFKKQATSTDAA